LTKGDLSAAIAKIAIAKEPIAVARMAAAPEPLGLIAEAEGAAVAVTATLL
jgi:hypothetical protein